MSAADDWEGVTEARVPFAALPRLARLRDRADIRVAEAEGVAWVRWTTSRTDVVRALLPEPGVMFFRVVNGVRFPFGSRLPTSDAPPADDRPLASVLLPAAAEPTPPDEVPPPRVPLRLVRGGGPQPATALLCPLESLRHWADSATTAELAAVSGVVSGERAVLFGAKLPAIPDATRFYGTGVLLPLGFRLDPDLPPAVVREAVGATTGEVVLLTADGHDRIPRDRAEPLTRAGLRLALTRLTLAGGPRP
ncbi:MAG: hypothetical protein ABGY75_02885 [Gemmataceae bacterium]